MDRSKRFTLFALPDRPIHSDTNSASLGSILSMQQLCATTKSLTFPPLSTATYSFIQLSQLECQWRERKYPIFETVAKGDSNLGSLDCESGIQPLSYRAAYGNKRCLIILLIVFFTLWATVPGITLSYLIKSTFRSSYYSCTNHRTATASRNEHCYILFA